MTEFEKIYREYFDDVYRYIRRLSGDKNIAEEITSEAFFKAMRSINGFRGDCALRVWLCQIAKNCYYTHLKKSKQTDGIADAGLPESSSEESTIEEQYMKHDEAARIRSVLHDMPEPYKDEEVTDFDYTVYDNPDGGDFDYCDIQAWTSLWDQWHSKGKEKLSATVAARHAKPIIAVYVPNDGSENICIAKYDPDAENRIEKDVDYGPVIVLPRLSLGYYLILAIAALVVSIIVWLLARKKAEVRIWAERIGLYSVSYIISHCIVSGISTTSYSLQRDFFLMIFISLLLYSGLLLTHSIWRLKKEIREINE